MHVITTQTEPISFPFFFHEGREGGTVGKRKEGREGGLVGGWVGSLSQLLSKDKKNQIQLKLREQQAFLLYNEFTVFVFFWITSFRSSCDHHGGKESNIMCLTDRGPVRRSVYNMFLFIIDRYQSRHSWGTASETIEQIWRVLGDHHNDRCVPEDDSKRYQEKLLRVSTTMGSWKCGIAS